jgi:hypothetical protein
MRKKKRKKIFKTFWRENVKFQSLMSVSIPALEIYATSVISDDKNLKT